VHYLPSGRLQVQVIGPALSACGRRKIAARQAGTERRYVTYCTWQTGLPFTFAEARPARIALFTLSRSAWSIAGLLNNIDNKE
jgi:hypothetical protein